MRPCPHHWEVEALHDKRLTGTDEARVLRHLQSCRSCADELRQLRELREAICGLPYVTLDEVTLRRCRVELLARADEELRRERREPRRGALIFGAGAAVAAIVGLSLFGLRQETDSSATRSAPPAHVAAVRAHVPVRPVLSVEPSEDAVFARSFENDTEIVRLQQGTITVTVSGPPGHVPVLVRTPDGEVLDEGTTFTVSVRDQRTRYVEVADGRVLVRVDGFAARSLGAGERYEPYGERRARPKDEALELPRKRAERTKRDASLKTDSATSRAPETNPRAADVLFGQAVRELREERCEEAARSFSTFLEQHPGDSRGEDAAFLRVVALTRVGLTARARAAAHLYLARYPQGLRVREVEALLTR